MAKRTTKTAALENTTHALLETQRIYLDAARERDDARAEAAQLRTQLEATTGDCEDGKTCARLAVVLCPLDDPKMIGPRDLEIACKNIASKQQRIAMWLRQAATQLDGDIDLTMDPEELAEAVNDAAKDAAKAKQELEALQEAAGDEDELTGLVEWFKQSSRSTAEWDRLVELVELLGFSGNPLAYILSAVDMSSAVRNIGA